jgi:hypothetical protein
MIFILYGSNHSLNQLILYTGITFERVVIEGIVERNPTLRWGARKFTFGKTTTSKNAVIFSEVQNVTDLNNEIFQRTQENGVGTSTPTLSCSDSLLI